MNTTGGSVRRALSLLLAASMLLGTLQSVEATILRYEDELEVEYDPDTLTLANGDIGAIYIMVRNLGDRTLHVQVAASGIEARGSSMPDVNNVMFILEPGGVDQVVVTVESRVQYLQDPEVSNVKISFLWGPNATMLQGGAFQLENPKFRNTIEYEVIDDNSGGWIWVLLLVAVAVVVVAIIVYRRGNRKIERPPVDRYGEGTHGR